MGCWQFFQLRDAMQEAKAKQQAEKKKAASEKLSSCVMDILQPLMGSASLRRQRAAWPTALKK